MAHRTRRHGVRGARVSVATCVVAAAVVVAGGPAQGVEGEPVSCLALGQVIDGATIEGDLLVEHHCTVTDTHVTGDVTVRGGTLVADGLTVAGDLRTDSRVTLDGSHVDGGIVLEPAGEMAALNAGAHLTDSSVRRSIRGAGAWTTLERSTVGGAVTVDLRYDLIARESTVAGWVTSRHSAVELTRSRLGKGFTAIGSRWISACDVQVAGDVTITLSHHVATLGRPAGYSCGRQDVWEGGWLDVGGSLRLVDNPHTIELERVRVVADLECAGNTGPRGVLVGDVTVGGSRTGQCAT